MTVLVMADAANGGSCDLGASLLRWTLRERPYGVLNGSFELDNASSAWSDGAALRIGSTVAFEVGGERMFDGAVVGLSARHSTGSPPVVEARVKGRRHRMAAGTPSTLRCGIELSHACVTVDTATAVPQLRAEAVSDLAVGTQVLRAGAVVVVAGLGTLFDGRFKLRSVTVSFDATRGLAVAAEGRRQS